MTLEEDRELLRAVREWRPPTTVHPIAMDAWKIYERHGRDLPPPAIQALRELLDLYKDDLQGLAEALEGLVRFVILLTDHQEDRPSGELVMKLLREYAQRFEPFWTRVAEALENVGGEVVGSFQKFSGRTSTRRAPIFDSSPPKGSIPLSDLMKSARPPPFTRSPRG